MIHTDPIHLYGIPNCDTVKRARAWLAEHAVAVVFHDLKREPPTPDVLQGWMAQVPWATLVNRQGTTWRKLDASPAQRDQTPGGGLARWPHHCGICGG
jgi:arsenate reductase (glutaredoxin)